MANPHLVDGDFQSDKYPTTPRGKVPLSTKDPMAQDLLLEYARRRRSVDADFADALEAALRTHGFPPPEQAPHYDVDDDGVMVALPAWTRPPAPTVRDVLELVSITVKLIDVITWTDDQVKAALLWAYSVHLYASDNDEIKVPPKPDFLPAETPYEPSVPGSIL
jgi:hypothetical protein